jgi:DNA-binding MarR family transcriptional regulator
MNTNQNDLDTLINTVLDLWRMISQAKTDDRATMLQMHILLQVSQRGPITMSELSQSCHMSLSSATQIVERLTKAGLIKRTADKTDRRRVCIELTKTGEAKLEELNAHRRARMKEILSNVPEKDIKELIRIQSNLINALDKEQKDEQGR